DFVLAPGVEGDLGVLPNHIPLLTPLRTGEVMVRNGEAEHILFVAGGFLEVLPDKVTILADAAERAEDIDEARAEESRKRAQELVAQDTGKYETSLAPAGAAAGGRGKRAQPGRPRSAGTPAATPPLGPAKPRARRAAVRRRRHGGHP